MVTHTIRRKLNPAQAKRREQILTATCQIISEKGIEALNMQDVASRAGVSRVTLYRYYSNREHLISDMAFAWGLSLVERLQFSTPMGNTFGERISAVFASIFREAQQNPNLTAATLHTLTSPNYSSLESQEIEQLLPSLLGMVIDEQEISDAKNILGTLERLVLANLLFLNSGRISLDEAVDNMAFVARRLYGDELWDRNVTDRGHSEPEQRRP